MNRISRLLVLFGLLVLLPISCKKDIEGFGPNTVKPLNYSLYNIPDIGTFVPSELLSAMHPYLHFGENPPKIDTCFHTPYIFIQEYIKADPTNTHNIDPGQKAYCLSFMFRGMHQQSIDSVRFEEPISKDNMYQLFANTVSADSIFIMGHDSQFTVFYNFTCKLNMTYAPNAPSAYQQVLDPLNGIEMKQKAILSGTAINNDSIPEYVFTKKNKEVIRTPSYTKLDSCYVTFNNDTIKKEDVRYLDTLLTSQITKIKDIRYGFMIQNDIEVPSFLSFFKKGDILVYSYPDTLIIDSVFYEGENRYRP